MDSAVILVTIFSYLFSKQQMGVKDDHDDDDDDDRDDIGDR